MRKSYLPATMFVLGLTTYSVGSLAEQRSDNTIRFFYQSSVDAPRPRDTRSLETSLLALSASRGDVEGMRAAHRYATNSSNSEVITALQQAYRSAIVGDGVSASQSLARAHAFTPDGMIGRYGVDGYGRVWVQSMDGANPARAAGAPRPVTAESILDLLNSYGQ